MIESENERQRKEIIALTGTISRLKEEINSEKSQDQIVS